MRRAITLIETLVAVALLGLTASILAVALGSAGDTAQVTAAISIIRDLDERARTLSQSAGPATLRTQHSRIWIEAPDADGLDAIAAERWTRPTTAIKLSGLDGAALDAIEFNRLGRSPDYRVDIAGAERMLALRICGLTGWIEEAP